MLIKTVDKVFKNVKGPIVVGLSGGPDSMALLHVMVELDLEPIAGYYNHNLRKDSNQEADFVQDYTESKKIRFMEGSGDVRHYAEMQNLSIEEAARNLRYDFLFQLASGMEAGAVVVAHHSGDQVETLLMNLLRGSGMRGLSGMKVVSKPNPWSDSIPLIRPMLEISKDQILDYLSNHEIPFWEDPSNLESIYHRNKIRQELIPQLEKLVPGFSRRMLQTALIFTEDNQTLDQFSNKAWESCVNTQGTSFIQIAREKFLKNPPSIQRRMLKKALRALRPEFMNLSFQQVERAIEFFKDPTQKASNWVAKVNLSQSAKKIVISTWETDLIKDQFPQMLTQKKFPCPEQGEFSLGNGWYFSIGSIDYSPEQFGQIEFPKDDFQVWIDKSALGENPEIRIRKEGELISPLGMDGKSMKVSDLMINEKIPALYRELWPLVVQSDTTLWIPGGRVSHQARVTAETKEIVKLTIYKEKSKGS